MFDFHIIYCKYYVNRNLSLPVLKSFTELHRTVLYTTNLEFKPKHKAAYEIIFDLWRTVNKKVTNTNANVLHLCCMETHHKHRYHILLLYLPLISN